MQRTLTTPRLHLRPFRPEDAARLVFLCNDIRVAGNMAHMPHPFTMADADEFLTQRIGLEGLHFFAACLGDETLIGCAAWGVNAENPNPDIAYWLGVDYFAQGFGSELAPAICADAFRQSGAGRLTASCKQGNEASRRLLVSMGFSPEGWADCNSRALGQMRTELFGLEIERFQQTHGQWLECAPQPVHT